MSISTCKLPFITLLLSLVIGSSSVFAMDKKFVDNLELGGMLLPTEVESILSNAVFLESGNDETARIQIYARIQTQLYYSQSEEIGGDELSRAQMGASIRRFFLGFWSDIGESWRFMLTCDFALTGAAGHKLSVTCITKKIDTDFFKGAIDFGYKTGVFGFEDGLASANLIAIDRSVVSRFFGNPAESFYGNSVNGTYGPMGMGMYYAGVFAHGSFKGLDEFTFSLNITNSESNTIEVANIKDNVPSLWWKVAYVNSAEFDSDKLNYEVGTFFCAAPCGNKYPHSGSTSGIYGVSPYFQLAWNGLSFWADFITNKVEDATASGSSQTPQGFDITGEYRFNTKWIGEIAPCFRYTHLNTNGRGLRLSDGIRTAPNLGTSAFYDNAQTVYLGINWYISNHDVKVQFGYEWAEFQGVVRAQAPMSNRVYVHNFLTQVQVLF